MRQRSQPRPHRHAVLLRREMDVDVLDARAMFQQQVVDAVHRDPRPQHIFGAHKIRTVLREVVIHTAVDIGLAARKHLDRVPCLRQDVQRRLHCCRMQIIRIEEFPRRRIGNMRAVGCDDILQTLYLLHALRERGVDPSGRDDHVDPAPDRFFQRLFRPPGQAAARQGRTVQVQRDHAQRMKIKIKCAAVKPCAKLRGRFLFDVLLPCHHDFPASRQSKNS